LPAHDFIPCPATGRCGALARQTVFLSNNATENRHAYLLP
jgi:hypothetical protein